MEVTNLSLYFMVMSHLLVPEAGVLKPSMILGQLVRHHLRSLPLPLPLPTIFVNTQFSAQLNSEIPSQQFNTLVFQFHS